MYIKLSIVKWLYWYICPDINVFCHFHSVKCSYPVSYINKIGVSLVMLL